MSGNISILDCTLRDGGQGLENLNDNGIRTEEFTNAEKLRIAELACGSGAEIVEIGCMSEIYDDSKEKYAIYHDIQTLSRFKPEKKFPGQIITGLYVDPDTPADRIPEYSPELVDGIRVILRYSQLKQSVEFCAALARKKYKVFVQPMLTMRYTDDELKYIIEASNEMGAYALYAVDSFGYMSERDVDRLVNFYGERLDPSVRIGFHAHNNMENAFANVKHFAENFSDRDRIIDACALGMGQGAGNMQTEVLVNYLNESRGTSYDLGSILEICDILEKFRRGDMETWGYSPLRFVPAVHKAAYKYAVAMKLQYNMSLVEIDRALSAMPDELRHRYTPDNLKQVLSNI